MNIDEEIGMFLATEEGRTKVAEELAKSGLQSQEYYKLLLDRDFANDLRIHRMYPTYKPYLKEYLESPNNPNQKAT